MKIINPKDVREKKTLKRNSMFSNEIEETNKVMGLSHELGSLAKLESET